MKSSGVIASVFSCAFVFFTCAITETISTRKPYRSPLLEKRRLELLKLHEGESSVSNYDNEQRQQRGRRLSMPWVTGWSTVPCDRWVTFYLQDVNPASGGSYLQYYGLGDIQPKAEVTILGLYFADDEDDQLTIEMQDQLGKELEDMDIVVHNAALNYYAPMACAMLECEMYWWNWNSPMYLPWWNTNNCQGYVGGCAPSDERLKPENWQLLLANKTTMPIFQDTEWEDAWENLGGGHGDIFIYDSSGRLFAYFCNQDSCPEHTVGKGVNATVVPSNRGDLTNATDYETIKAQAIEASKQNGTERCRGYEDDDMDYYYYRDDDDSTFYALDDYYYYDYYYYYKDGTTTDPSSSSEAAATDDNDDNTVDDDAVLPGDMGYDINLYKDDDLIDDDDPRYYRYRHRRRKMFTSVYVVVTILSVGLLAIGLYVYYKTRSTSEDLVGVGLGGTGTHKFTRLSTRDDDSMPATGLEVEMRQPQSKGPKGDDWNREGVGYGSL